MHKVLSSRWTWRLLLFLGTALPYAAFLPWLLDRGLDPVGFLQAAFANAISAFFTLDVLVSGITLLGLAWRLLPWRKALWVTGMTLGVGVSAGLPLLILLAGLAQRRATLNQA